MAFEQAVLDAIPSIDSVDPVIVHGCQMAGVRDAGETLVFARQMEQVKNRTYERKFAELKGSRFVPTSNEGGEAAEFLVYRFWDSTAMAKIVSNYQTDIPLVTASAQEKFVKYFQVADGYQYSIDDLRQAARAGVPLQSKLADAARRGIELAREDIVAIGAPEIGTFGLLNHPNVSLTSLPNGTWASASGEDILEDLNYLVTSMQVNTLEIFEINTILVSVSAYRLLATKLLSATNASNVSVLDMFKKQNPGITVDSWTKLETANAAGTGGRIVAYHKSPEVLEFEVGIEFEIMPAEYHHMMFTHVCRARYAGVQIQYPVAVTYADSQLI